MSSSIAVPAQFGWVVAAVASTAWLGLWQSLKVGRARKAAKIQYPQAYAEKAEAETSEAAFRLNCAQRAHANTLESVPYIISTAVIWGLKQPVYSAIALEAWVLSRILFTVGYINNGPSGRYARGNGKLNMIAMLALYGGGTWAAFKFVVDSL